MGGEISVGCGAMCLFACVAALFLEETRDKKVDKKRASVGVQIFFALSASFTAAAAPVQSRRTTDNTDARRHA